MEQFVKELKEVLKERLGDGFGITDMKVMNLDFLFCGVLVIPFAIIGLLFAIFKDKTAKSVSAHYSKKNPHKIVLL